MVAFLTFGEGYHNYHHKFQWDYRNGAKWYNFDPSKWIIKFLSYFNITHSLRKAPDHSIFQAKINTVYSKITNLSKVLKLGSSRTNKIKLIMENAGRNITLWKNLEARYNVLKNSHLKSEGYKTYQKKINQYREEIDSSFNSLVEILSNMKESIGRE